MPSQQSLVPCKPFYSCLYYITLLFSSHFPNLSALYCILILSSKVLRNTYCLGIWLTGSISSCSILHLLPIANLGARSVPVPGMCSTEYTAPAFIFVAALSFPMWDVKPTQDYFAPWKILDAWYHRNEQSLFAPQEVWENVFHFQ